MIKRIAMVDERRCVSCGACVKECPKGALSVKNGIHAFADPDLCVGCGKCAKICPADCIRVLDRPEPVPSVKAGTKRPRRWYDYLWIWTIIYFALGFFNIVFAWLGMIDFMVPVLIALFGGDKWFCNNLCGRGQLLTVLGEKKKLSRNRPAPGWISSKAFRYGFLVFFLTMFGNMLFQTWLVFSGAASLRQAVKLFWTFRVPWSFAYTPGLVPDWIAQYSFGFYSIMLTSTLIGLIVMALYRPRTWCSFCPMGTMTQLICRLKHR